ncbi:TPA: regulator [Escherichia coli]
MSKTLLDLLNKTREDIAAKRGKNTDLTRLKDGINYIRIFPNKDDPNGKFFQTFGMHYIKYQNEEGKEATNAYICEQHTHGRACQLCEMVMEGRARHKGNKAMEERIGQMRATPRYLVNGILSTREDFSDAEKCQLIELPSTVFDDICKAITEDIADDIGNPLSKEEGYAFQIKRTGSGRDTEYDVSPKRKVFKGDIEDKFWNNQHDLIAYVNQADETRLLATVRTMGRLIGIAAPTATASAPAISSTAKTSASALPGFGSITGHTEGATAVATAHTPASEPTSLVDEEVLRAMESEFKSETSSAAASAKESEADATTSVAAASAAEDEGIDDLLKELESLNPIT